MVRKRPPSFDFFPGDFMAGTLGMELAEVGAYIRLLCYQWEHETLPNDERTLARIAGAFPDEFSKIWPNVKTKFISTNGEADSSLYNERLEAERQKKQEISEKRAAAAFAMHLQSKQGCKKDAKGSRKKEVGRKSNPRDSSPYSEDFESFWNAYPKHRRKSKGAAWKAWLSAVKSVPSELIIRKAAEYSNSYDGNRGQYTKLPTTWLNQACWEDDAEAWKDAEDESKEPTGSRVPTQQELDNWNPQG